MSKDAKKPRAFTTSTPQVLLFRSTTGRTELIRIKGPGGPLALHTLGGSDVLNKTDSDKLRAALAKHFLGGVV